MRRAGQRFRLVSPGGTYEGKIYTLQARANEVALIRSENNPSKLTLSGWHIVGNCLDITSVEWERIACGDTFEKVTTPLYFVGQKYKLTNPGAGHALAGATYEVTLSEDGTRVAMAMVNPRTPAETRAGWRKVKDPHNLTETEWAKITGNDRSPDRKWELMNPATRPERVIRVSDLNRRIQELATEIRQSKNSKDKARLVDEQAALLLVKRNMKIVRASVER